jgi:toxin ParE1/3/4
VKVKFTPTAKAQFLAGLNHIRQDNPVAAQNLRLKAYGLLKRLEQHPDSGRSIPEFPELSYREVLVNPYRFFYRVDGKTVWIVSVWHMAQLPKEPNKGGA